MSTNNQITTRRDAALARGVGVATNVYVSRAENAEVWDVEGRRYIDFAAGIAVVNTGHRHPKIIEAAKQQLDSFTHTCHQVFPYENYVALAERLNELAPISGAAKSLFVTTGAEAVENAIKIARAATGRSAIISFDGAFHGRTFMGMSLTGKVSPYKVGFGQMIGDIFRIPFPMSLHGISSEDAIAALEALFRSDVDPTRVAAIVIEPVQGEGGFYVAPKDFMRALRKICGTHGILLIADEIQTGFGRTGKMFAMEHYEVKPDLMTMAKGLAGGFPLAGVVGRAEIMDAPGVGGLGGTYGGNPVSIAASHAVLDIIKEEKLCERAELLGARLRQRLVGLIDQVPEIAEVRGLGQMNAIEFNVAGTKKPNADFSNRVRAKALEDGLVFLPCGVFGNVNRFLPPLTIDDAVFNEGLDKLERALISA